MGLRTRTFPKCLRCLKCYHFKKSFSSNRTTGILKISPKASSKSSISARSGTPTKIHSEQDTKRMEVSYCTPLDHEIAMVLSPVGSVC
jgi:hypothetical protein